MYFSITLGKIMELVNLELKCCNSIVFAWGYRYIPNCFDTKGYYAESRIGHPVRIELTIQ